MKLTNKELERYCSKFLDDEEWPSELNLAKKLFDNVKSENVWQEIKELRNINFNEYKLVNEKILKLWINDYLIFVKQVFKFLKKYSKNWHYRYTYEWVLIDYFRNEISNKFRKQIFWNTELFNLYKNEIKKCLNWLNEIDGWEKYWNLQEFIDILINKEKELLLIYKKGKDVE